MLTVYCVWKKLTTCSKTVLLRVSSHDKLVSIPVPDSPEPSCVPPVPGRHNTILQGLDIISQFFRLFAPAINFWSLLHKVLCNVFFQSLFFRPLHANGSGGGFLVIEAAIDIHMLMKGAPRSSPAVGVPNSPTVGWFEGTTATTHTCPKRFGENRRHVQFVSYCTAWLILSIFSALLLAELLSLETQQRKEWFTGHLVWRISNLDSLFLFSPSV